MNALLLFTVMTCNPAPDVPNPMREISGFHPVVAFYTIDARLQSSGECKLVYALWPDGHLVWSKDLTFGGEPYLCSTISIEKVTELQDKLEHDGYFESRALIVPHVTPDSRYSVVSIKKGQKSLTMESSHDINDALFRKSSRENATAPSVSRRYLDRIAGLGKDELYFRHAWWLLRSLIFEYIPSDGDNVNGGVTEKNGRFYWMQVE